MGSRRKTSRFHLDEGSGNERRLSSPWTERRDTFGLVRLPDGDDWIVGGEDEDGRMQPHLELGQTAAVERGESGSLQRLGIRSVVRATAQVFEPRDIGEI